MFDENDEKLLAILEKQGKDFLSDSKSIYQPREQIDATSEQILNLLHNIAQIESNDTITGLLMNLSSFVSIESADQVWKDLITACQHVNCYLDVFGIMETLRTLVVLGGDINPLFLDFLINPEIPYDLARPYALETLFEYFPSNFFTFDNDRKFFFAELLINSFATGDIYHRSFLILIFFALHLNTEQILSLTNLQAEFWKIIFDISVETDFYHLLAPARKLKALSAPFFQQENPFISESLLDFHSKIGSSEDYIPLMLNLFKVFYLFPTNDIIDFLRFSHDAFLSFTPEQWTDIKSISQHLYEVLDDARFSEDQVQEIFEFSGTLPETGAKYFIFVHFIEIFTEVVDFVDQFIRSLCQDWMQSDAFNPVVYCFCISQVSNYLDPKDETFVTVIYPSIFSFIEAEDNVLLNYEALKALNHLYRDDIIKVSNFCNSLLELTLKANPQSLKYFFKIILEIEKHTRDNDDEPSSNIEEEEDSKEKSSPSLTNRQIHEKLEEFTRSNFVVEDINPILLGYLCDTLTYFITDDESDDFIQHCAAVCHRLSTDPVSTEDPNILIHVASLILNIFRNANPEKLESYFALFHPIYDILLGLVSQFNFAPEEGSEINVQQHIIMGNVAFLLSHISKKARNSELSFEFPLLIISNILNSSFIEVIKPGLSNAIRQLPLYYLPEEGQNRELFLGILNQIVFHAETTNSFIVLNMCFKVFIAIFKKLPELIQSDQSEQLEQINPLDKLDPISQHIEQMKCVVFEERMKILNNQSIVKIKVYDNIHHFEFFEFLSALIKNNYILTLTEILTLIKWSENIPTNFYQDLATTFVAIIRSGQLAQYDFVLNPLWNALNLMLEEMSSNFDKNSSTIMSILYAMSDFLTFTSTNSLGIYNCKNLYHSLVFFWRYDSTKKKKNFNILKLLGPIYLHIYSMTKRINDINFAILNQIFDAMIECNIKSWNIGQMIHDIILLYEKFSTLHLCKESGADVLFSFYRYRNKYNFAEEFLGKIRETLNDMQYHDSIVDYLREKYKNQPNINEDIDDAFDLFDKED